MGYKRGVALVAFAIITAQLVSQNHHISAADTVTINALNLRGMKLMNNLPDSSIFYAGASGVALFRIHV